MQANTVVSYILFHDASSSATSRIQAFCKDNRLIHLREHSGNLLDVLSRNINLGAIFLAEESQYEQGNGLELARLIHQSRPEVPIFLRTGEIKTHADLPCELQHCIVGVYHLDTLSDLEALVEKHIFSDDYPNHLLNAIQTLSTEVIESQLQGMTVEVGSPKLVNDRLIHGDLHSIISLESNWCKGHMMVEVNQDELGQLIRHDKTLLGSRESSDFRGINAWLGEMTNLLWGVLKSKVLSQANAGQPISDVQLPIITNHRERYITFGTTKPHLCITYTFRDDSGVLPDTTFFQKFIFSVTWLPSFVSEQQIVLADDDDCVFF